MWGQNRRPIRPYHVGYAAALVAVGVHPAWLAGDDLRQYMATSAQVLAAILIALVLGARDDDEHIVREQGLHAIAFGLAAALAGLVISPSAKIAAGAAFVLATGGIAAGLTAVLFLIDHRRRTPPPPS